jgi:alpha-ketoglutarate-dependent taurine dioxygenase
VNAAARQLSAGRLSTQELGLSPARGATPLVVTPTAGGSGLALAEAFVEISGLVEQHLLERGGLLFRGFQVEPPAGLGGFAAAFGHPLLSYDYASTPRSQVSEGVYTSTEYPPHQAIPLHNEQSYSRAWPMKIWFHCVLAARCGGETPIADSREIYRRVDPALRRRFEERGVMYVRNFGNGLDLPWTRVFNTERRQQVEDFCRGQGIEVEWKEDGELRTRQVCQAVAQHPRTAERVWFNQAHLFHPSALSPEVLEALLDAVGEEELPRTARFGDGSPIESSALDEIRGVLSDLQIVFPWQSGDVLLLDNMLMAHARLPFEGPRKVVVAMAEPHGAA